jgi:hypothetical protein
MEGGEYAVQDDIVIYELMTDELDRQWWKECLGELTLAFHQALIIVRVSEIELL